VNATPVSYFERLWSGSDDPWDHAGRWYEARKYDLTSAALPAPRYRHIVEPACGVGLLTTRLARRAERVTASDRFPAAVEATARRCADLAHVATATGDVRDGPAGEPYDAAVLSEVLYYFDEAVVADVLRAWHDGCSSGGHLALAHYRPVVADHVLTGDDVHAVAHELFGTPTITVADPSFLIDVYAVGAKGG
jgi:2-polyprenyl-3-methyl-5-hydroxy-6-metoxy-1,4-benzoquinol methylase